MTHKPTFAFFLLFCLPFLAAAALPTDSLPRPPQSRLINFSTTGDTDTNRVALIVALHEQDTGEPVLGATVLLQRHDPEQVHGKITQWDGQCTFKIAPGAYKIRVQLTGYVAFEQENIELSAGKQFDMKIEMACMKPPVPSAKQQAGKNTP